MKISLCIFSAILIALVFVPNEVTSNPISDCWNQWSRCTKWSSGGTGVLWQDCEKRCKCQGYAEGGSCVKVPSECFLSDEAYQCQCKGSKGAPTGENCGL